MLGGGALLLPADAGAALIAEAVADAARRRRAAVARSRPRPRARPIASRPSSSRPMLALGAVAVVGRAGMRILFVVQRYGRDVPGGAGVAVPRARDPARARRPRRRTSRPRARAATPTGPTSTSRDAVDRRRVRAPLPPSRARAIPRSSPTSSARHHARSRAGRARAAGGVDAAAGPVGAGARRVARRARRRVRRRGLRHLPVLDVVGGPARARRPDPDVARSHRARRADAAAPAAATCCSRSPTRWRSSPKKRPQLVRERFPARRPARCSVPASTSTAVGAGVGQRVPRAVRARRPAVPRRSSAGSTRAKGSDELVDFFVAYRERNPAARYRARRRGRADATSCAAHPDVDRHRLRRRRRRDCRGRGRRDRRATVVLRELLARARGGMGRGKPALVQRACAVTNGQAHRSGGGIPYRGYAEFEAAVDLLLDSPELARAARRAREALRRGAVLVGRGAAPLRTRLAPRSPPRPGEHHVRCGARRRRSARRETPATRGSPARSRSRGRAACRPA